jgi:hypothetical protein
MQMRGIATSLLVFAAAAAGCPVSGQAAQADLRGWIETRTQALFDAIAIGDKGIWDRTMDTDCVITTEDGEVMGKAKFLSDLRPLPRGFSGHGKIRDLTVRDLGEVALVHYRIDEWESIFAQELKTTYVETDTYRRSAGNWKMVAMQLTVVPQDLEPIVADPSVWPALEGEYGFPGDDQMQVRYRVFARNGALFGGRDEKSATALIPLAPLVFFQAGSIHLMIFVKNEAGAVTEVREIHKYNEVRMQRASRNSG